MYKQLSQIYTLTLLIVICFTFLNGCSSVSYYHQAVSGHLSLMMSTEPVEEWLAAGDTPDHLKKKLQLAQKARQFAQDRLHLPVGDAFSEYVELDRPWVLVNLVAVPEFSLDAHQWCYPFIGCQAYRGYYDLEDARAEAREFKQLNYDTFIGGVTAYSTLGWFDDPLHTGFTRLSDSRMVALMFHELAHQVIYINEDTAFNESFATAVELEGLRAWLEQQGDTSGFDTALERLRQREQTLELVEDATARLRQLYDQQATLSDSSLREQKRRILAGLRQAYLALAANWNQPGPFGSDPGELNNANLALFRQYNQYVPAFRQLFRESGEHFDRFYEAVHQLGELDAEDRAARLNSLTQRFHENL
ncbi:aminopeptidase [Marinobacter sp. CHS3-4]|uniref:aminopeptidase n=1 Tax=Marinobacter sp. CHS3-4 TaxID=3045174 RepID=UPI0024B5F9C6|nr:aminopeptidase [Marinobacter sp. CHS3-4]MDI9244128.1 aminopeptidase [Marinobacter sp. CHS3-4]